MVILNTSNFRLNSHYLSQFFRYKNGRPHFGNFKTRRIWCYPNFGRQCYVYKTLATVSNFCLLQSPRSTKTLLWFRPWTLIQTFLKEQIIFIEWTTARMKIARNRSRIERNYVQSNCAQFLGIYRARNCAQVKSTCVGNPIGNTVDCWVLIKCKRFHKNHPNFKYYKICRSRIT